jgi:hypothetical protein
MSILIVKKLFKKVILPTLCLGGDRFSYTLVFSSDVSFLMMLRIAEESYT